MISFAVAYEPAVPVNRADYRRWVAQQPGGRFERVNSVVETRLVVDGRITLDPPGITIAVEDIYGS